jgi:hypothetical protein
MFGFFQPPIPQESPTRVDPSPNEIAGSFGSEE